MDEADFCANCQQPALKKKCVRAAASAAPEGDVHDFNEMPNRSRKAPAMYVPAEFWARPLPTEQQRMGNQKQRAADRAFQEEEAHQKAAEEEEARVAAARAEGFEAGVRHADKVVHLVRERLAAAAAEIQA